ncbi:MAG: Bax inhibitor-1 family protein [Candidatus Omnitrophica bacterium]|nr:Bax inhibitor-1 family protein [Candidatus Omnitrophota bacterium]
MNLNNVFNRDDSTSSGQTISANIYNLVIGLVLCWGFFINYLIIKNVAYQSIAQINPILFFIGYIGSCFLGISMFKSSDNPLISFVGYNFVVVPFGFVINLIVSQYDPMIVQEAIRVTGLVTAFMMLLGTLFPDFFKKIIGGLTIALFAVIIIELIEVFIFKMHHGFLDYIVVLIFCGYIGYDWARANNIPKTLDNAVDSAASLYIDIINLFIRILRIMGRRNN